MNAYPNLVKFESEIEQVIKLFLFSGRFVSLCVDISSDNYDVVKIRKLSAVIESRSALRLQGIHL